MSGSVSSYNLVLKKTNPSGRPINALTPAGRIPLFQGFPSLNTHSVAPGYASSIPGAQAAALASFGLLAPVLTATDWRPSVIKLMGEPLEMSSRRQSQRILSDALDRATHYGHFLAVSFFSLIWQRSSKNSSEGRPSVSKSGMANVVDFSIRESQRQGGCERTVSQRQRPSNTHHYFVSQKA
jgi:hypothetical protein